MSRALRWTALVAALTTGCVSAGRIFAPLFESERKVEHKLQQPVQKQARLAALWVGHATVLLQMDDKLIMTDPVFTSSVGQLSARLVEPGLDVEHVPRLDAVVISHLHFDHLSLGSLELLEDRIGQLVMPEGGLVYLTDFRFPAGELARWHSYERDGLRITAVPVKHNGMRYGLDRAWMETSYTGYVFEYRGQTVYFGGDTAYDQDFLDQTVKRFPKVDLALLPIAPVQPRGFMGRSHIEPDEALRMTLQLGARWMLPIHFDTFVNSEDEVGYAPKLLLQKMRDREIPPERVTLLDVGQQHIYR